jgi:uncharacterized protein (DUF433 family)
MARGKKRTSEPHRQFSVRVSTPVFEGLERRTAELAESRNALAERYIAEGLKMDEHPEIYFREGALGRRAAIIGTRLDVWQAMDTLRNSGNSVNDAAEYLGLPVERVRAAVRYYAAYRDEVDEFAARATAIAERAEAAWRAEQEILAG